LGKSLFAVVTAANPTWPACWNCCCGITKARAESPRALIYQIHTARRHLAELAHVGQRCNAERPVFSAEERIYIAAAEAISLTWFTHVQELIALPPEPPRKGAPCAPIHLP